MAPLLYQLTSLYTMNVLVPEGENTFGDKAEKLPDKTLKKDLTSSTERLSYEENEVNKTETLERGSTSKAITEGTISKTITEEDKQFLNNIKIHAPEETKQAPLIEKIPSPGYVITKKRIYINELKEDIIKLKTFFDDEDKLAVYVYGLKETIKKTMRELLPLKDEGFLLIVSLIQDTLLSQGWRQYSKSTLDVLIKILESCVRSHEVTFADYEKALRQLDSNKIDTFPLIPSNETK